MSAAALSIFRHLFASVAEEMGVTLGRTAFSANIKERLDFSCALFTADGALLAQAAHIPVHLGAMPASVRAAIRETQTLNPGDVVILNDPYAGGTHLPDVTMISPYFEHTLSSADSDHDGQPLFFVASRAHHADIGGISPGSMPISRELYQEGLIIPPVKLVESGHRDEGLWRLILSNVRTPVERAGDFNAQFAANQIGLLRLRELIERYGLLELISQSQALIEYTNRLTRVAISKIPNGKYTFIDYMDDDGQGSEMMPICVSVDVDGEYLHVDFTGTAPAVAGNLNAVPAIVKSAVAYCVRCLALAILNDDLPMNQGAIDPISITIEPGSLLDPRRPRAVAAGNVETSQRIVDVVFGALSQALPKLIPAASQGTMNNFTFGARRASMSEGGNAVPDQQFAYYETIGGGIGAGPSGPGGDGMHAHMSNTRNTPVEALEYAFPLRVENYSSRSGSGGEGLHSGGEGLIRQVSFQRPVTVTIVSERRRTAPYGLQGGKSGVQGKNSLTRNGASRELPGKITLDLDAGDVLTIETPGGGGWGSIDSEH